MQFVVRYWEWLGAAFAVASAVFWVWAALPETVAPDRYTASDAAADLAEIERQIEALQKGIMGR